MSKDRSPPTRHSAGRRWLKLAVTAVIVVGVLFLLVMTFGQVTGLEFSPDRFERRSFVYYQIPLLKLQISPVLRDNVSNDLERHIRRQKLISGPPRSRRWDVVSVSFGAEASPREGPAQVLCRYLDQSDERDLWWLQWSRAHPELAGPFWSAIQQAAQLNAYFLIPEMFDLAVHAKDPTDFCEQLDELLTRRYTEVARDYQALGRTAEAQRLFAAARQVGRTDRAEVSAPSVAFP